MMTGPLPSVVSSTPPPILHLYKHDVPHELNPADIRVTLAQGDHEATVTHVPTGISVKTSSETGVLEELRDKVLAHIKAFPDEGVSVLVWAVTKDLLDLPDFPHKYIKKIEESIRKHYPKKE